MKKKTKVKKQPPQNSGDGRRRLKMKPLRKKQPKSLYLYYAEDESEYIDIFKDYRKEEE